MIYYRGIQDVTLRQEIARCEREIDAVNELSAAFSKMLTTEETNEFFGHMCRVDHVAFSYPCILLYVRSTPPARPTSQSRPQSA